MFNKKKQSQDTDSSGALNKKALVCSSEAAAISIGIHVLIIIFAGSIVAMKYVQKRDAAFAGENIARPKLERRELQMPVKVQNLQKKSRRPKVTSRMASVSQASFALPDTQGMGDIGGGFDRSGSGRSLSSMGAAGSFGFGLSGINFFGIKSKGEKVIFVVEAEREMVQDSRGGYYTYQYAKDRLSDMISKLHSATLFNVMFFVKDQTVMFGPKLIPATEANKAAVVDWYARVNDSPQVVGKISKMSQKYEAGFDYDSDVGHDASGWITAVQAALEQRADNIFILCSDWGTHWICKENKKTMFDADLGNEQEWLTSQGWPPERVAEYKKKRAAVSEMAKEALGKENAAREKKGLPPRIVARSEWKRYMRDDLKLKLPIDPPRRPIRRSYVPEEIIEHFNAVYTYHYKSQKSGRPKINIVKLIASDDSSSGDSSLGLKRVANEFKGRFELLSGAKTMEDLIKYNVAPKE